MLHLQPAPSEQSHEEVFLERYQKLYAWLLQFTEGDRDLARDLVQDAFVHFTFVRPDLRSIRNLDAYLFELARNLHLSQVRRAINSRVQQLSIIDYDSTELGLRAIDVREQIQVQDELRRICHYACVRKESAWAASVLILRFFYGYYPSEIARILRNTRSSVDVLLRCARHEAKLYLEEPAQLSFMQTSTLSLHSSAGFAREAHDLITELRQLVFHSCKGECLTNERLNVLYRSNDKVRMECVELAHVVSCPVCLDAVNTLLGISLLRERYPLTTLGKESKSKKGPRGPGDGASGGGATGDAIKSVKRHANETFEHKPNELYVAVNGYTLGSHRINARRNELTLDVNVTEPIRFVEVFSEQQVRLLFSCIEIPPAGAIKQPLRVGLSEGRTLEVILKFSSPWPNLRVVYADPMFIDADQSVAVYQSEPAAPMAPQLLSGASEEFTTRLSTLKSAASFVSGKVRTFFTAPFWLTPHGITAVLAILLATTALGFLLYRAPSSKPLLASDLLLRSSASEDALAAGSDIALHRIVSLEERSALGQVLAHRRIEVWQSTERGITARRLYNEDGVLIAGDWRRADGVQTIYHHGLKPQLQIRNPQSAIRNFDSVWQLSFSAKEFAALIPDPGNAVVDERPNAYVIRFDSHDYAPTASASMAAIRTASIVLSKVDLHPIEQRFLIEQGTETREYRFLETSFERRPIDAVAPAVFEPEPELLGPGAPERRHDDAIVSSSPIPPVPLSRVVATPELEVEVLRLLSQTGADLGEQISVTRSANGLLSVQGIVDTEKRKSEILRALSSVDDNPAVTIDVKTVDEALKQRKQDNRSSEQVVIEQTQPESNAIPADADLRRYFVNKGLSGSQLDMEINRFANRAIAHARAALFRASALKRLTDRFSREELRTLDPEARAKWLGMIREHARAFQNETSALRRDLEPIFNLSTGGDVGEIIDDADLVRTAARLVELARSNNDAIQSSFTLSSGSSSSVAVRSEQFWRSLRSSESLALAINRL
jgi:DNA-directed RNA polymerase specialized sigma24 family protein